MAKNVYQFGQGSNFGGDYVAGDKIENHISLQQDLVTASKEIKRLLESLDKSYDSSTPTGMAFLTAKAVEEVEKQPILKNRIINAIKAGGTSALEEAVDHPAVKPVVAMLKGFMEG